MKKLFSFLIFGAIIALVSCSKGGDEDDKQIVVAFSSLAANGNETETTTVLTLTFDKVISGLTSGDITLTAGATKGALTPKGGGVYELGVSGITAAGNVTVAVSKTGYTITPSSKSVAVKYVAPVTAVAFSSLAANGDETETTSMLTLTFDHPIEELAAADITLTTETGATKGALTAKGGGVYELAVSGITKAGEVTVAVVKTGYAVTPPSKSVAVKYVAPDIAVAFSSLTADGDSAATTTKLTLTFDKVIEGLAAGDITLTTETGATKGALTAKGNGVYELAVSGVTKAGEVTVAVAKKGYAITPASRSVAVKYAAAVAFTSLVANGSGTETTTILTLTFDKAIEGLTAEDITLTAGATGAAKGALTAKGNGVYELAVSGIAKAGDVTVAVAKTGYAITPASKNVAVNYAEPVVFVYIVDIMNISGTTIGLELHFDKVIEGLTAEDITLTAGVTGATKGALTAKGNGIYKLAVSGITKAGEVTVAVAKTGYAITPSSKSVKVSCVENVQFVSLVANGSISETTTKLILTFDKDIEGLTAANISMAANGTGATKGALTAKGGGVYELAVSDIRNTGDIELTISYIPGYSISPTSRRVTVNYVPTIPFVNLTASGNANETTTKLFLSFEMGGINGLSAGDITFSAGGTGATMEALNMYNPFMYELVVSGITKAGNVTVAVSKTGYIITPSSRSVAVHYAEPVEFISLTADGGNSSGGWAPTTKLTLTFDKDIKGFSVDDIKLSGINVATNVTIGGLTAKGNGVYELDVSLNYLGGMTLGVYVRKDGYEITPGYLEVAIYGN